MRSRVPILVGLCLAAGGQLFGSNSHTLGQEPDKPDVDRQAVLRWIVSLDGEYDVDADRPGNPVIHVRLDRTRGIDPGGSPDELRMEDLSLLARLPELQTLTLAGRPRFNDDGLTHLSRLKSLKSLNLTRTRIHGKGLGLLAELKDLRRLSLQYCSSLDLSEVGALTQLEQLNLDNIGNTRVGDRAWAFLSRGSSMTQSDLKRSIRFRDTYRAGLDDDQAENLAPLINLKSLSLSHTRITSEGLRSIGQLTKLEHLDLGYTAIDDDGLQHLSQLANLTSLSLAYTGVTDAGVKHLLAFPKLQRLNLSGTAVAGPATATLAKLAELRQLELRFCPLTDDHIPPLADLKHLECVTLCENEVTLDGLTTLAKQSPRMTLATVLFNANVAGIRAGGFINAIAQESVPLESIKTIQLSEMTLDDDALAFLAEFPNLTHLYLTRSDFSDNALRHLRRLKQLERLSLYGTKTSDEELRHLSGLRNLSRLSLSRTNVTGLGLARLTPLRKLTRVDVTDTQVSLGALATLLTRNGLSIDDVLTSARCVRKVTVQRGDQDATLLQVDLRDQQCSDWDLEWLGAKKDIDALIVDNGGEVTSKGVTAISQMRQLSTLWLKNILLNRDDLRQIVSLPQLDTLWLTDASLNSKDLPLLEDCPHLRCLNLCGNPIDDAALSTLSALNQLQVLIVDPSKVSQAAVDEFRNARPDVLLHLSQFEAIRKLRTNSKGRDHRPVYTKSSGPPDVTRLLGPEYFAYATRIVDFPKIPLEALPYLKYLRPTLEDAGFASSPHGAAIIKEIVNTRIRRLSLYRVQVTDADLPPLAELDSLEEIDLQRTPVTDACLITLQRLPNLREIHLGGNRTNVGDEGMVHLAQMSKLEELHLSQTHVTDAGLVHIGTLKHLKHLSLRGVQVSDGLKHLRELRSLEELDLSGSAIEDAGAESLAELTSLKRLRLYDTAITPETVETLKRRLPHTRITYRQRTEPKP